MIYTSLVVSKTHQEYIIEGRRESIVCRDSKCWVNHMHLAWTHGPRRWRMLACPASSRPAYSPMLSSIRFSLWVVPSPTALSLQIISIHAFSKIGLALCAVGAAAALTCCSCAHVHDVKMHYARSCDFAFWVLMEQYWKYDTLLPSTIYSWIRVALIKQVTIPRAEWSIDSSATTFALQGAARLTFWVLCSHGQTLPLS